MPRRDDMLGWEGKMRQFFGCAALLAAILMFTGCATIAMTTAMTAIGKVDALKWRVSQLETRAEPLLRQACIAQHPDWPAQDCARIAKGETWIGMTREQIVAAWGPPSSAEMWPDGRNEHLKWGLDHEAHLVDSKVEAVGSVPETPRLTQPGA